MTAHRYDLVRRFACDDSGATAMEYGLILALISTVIIVSATGIGGHVSDMFSNLVSHLSIQ